ncbi:MAG: hypothetical protein J5511_01305 [Bacilli bacterium]|nr:hypothetical protein [Bacilli bacterium]
MRKRAIISAAIMAAFLAAGAVGGTIAYFSKEAKTEVNITSGNFALTSVVSELKTYSLDVAQEDGKFENGGTASLNQSTQVITLDRMTPGDKATFKVGINLENNIKIKYRVKFSKSGDLAPALEANVSGGASNWTTVEPSENATVINLDASIEIPFTTTVDYLNKSAVVKIVVEAVQFNMPTVSDASGLEAALDAIPAEGGEANLYIAEDINLNEVLEVPSNSEINLYGDGDVKITAPEGARRPIILDEVENATLNITGVDIEGPSTGTYTNAIGMFDTTNCTVNLNDVDVEISDYYGINVGSGNENLEINIENSSVQAWGAFNIWSPNTVVNVKNSTIRGVNPHSDSSNAFGVVVINSGATGVHVNFENCVVEAIQQGDQWEAFYMIQDTGAVINSVNTTYKLTRPNAAQPEIYESIEKALDYSTFIRGYNSSTNAYVGTYSAEVQYGDDPEELGYYLVYATKYSNTTQLTDTTGYLYGERRALLAADLYGEAAPKYSITDATFNGKKSIVVDYTF